MWQYLSELFFAYFGTVEKIVGVGVGIITGASTVWAWLRSRMSDKDARIKGFEAQVANLEEKNHKLRSQVRERDVALDAARQDLKQSTLAGVLEHFDREERDGNYERAASVLKEFFERERRNLGRVAGALGDWYGAFIGDESAGGALPLAQRYYELAALAEPESERWQAAADELSLVAKLDALNQR